MVGEEHRVARTGEDIDLQAADRKVPTEVRAAGHTRALSWRLAQRVEALHVAAAADDLGYVGRRQHGLTDGWREVALEAARVITQAAVGPYGQDADVAEIDLPVREGPLVHTAAAGGLRPAEGLVAGRRAGRRREDVVAAVVVDAVAAERRVRAVEERRSGLILVVERPVPVGLRALVAALVAQRFLVQPRVVPMCVSSGVIEAVDSVYRWKCQKRPCSAWSVIAREQNELTGETARFHVHRAYS